MAATTPPRPASPASRPNVAVQKSSHPLQISPNLEALLQHDELTRRNSGSSPTNGPAGPTTTPSEFSISLPPPPPRKVQGFRKASQREQEVFHTARSKEEKRKWTAIAGADCWPNALPTALPPDDGQSTTMVCSNSSRPATPNPYINPTPVLMRTDDDRDDDAPMPRHAEFSEHLARSVTDLSRSTFSSDPSYRPSSASNKVEKILWMGRDSLSLFSGSTRNTPLRHAEHCDADAVQDRQMRQVPAHCVSRPASRFGDPFDTATVSSSSSSPSPYFVLPVSQGSFPDPTFDFASARSHPIKSDFNPTKEPSPVDLHPAAFLPRLSLPSIFMSHHSPSRSPRPADDLADSDLSFIDFFSPSMSEVPENPCIKHPSSSRPQLESISMHSPSLHTLSRCNSSNSLASMRFAAPPSPTAVSLHHPSPSYCRTESSSSSITLSSMKFAPPSPSIDRVPPTRLQPLSEPASPYSPLEFAPPPSPIYEAGEKPSPSIAPAELAPERTSRPKSKKRSMSSSPRAVCHTRSSLPPTTNQLGANERADLIRRNRKLARVFGRMPGTEEPATELDEPRQLSKKLHSPTLAALLSKQKIHRQAMSVSVAVKTSGLKTEPSTPWQTDGCWSPDGRRHSTPLATGSFKLYVSNDGEAEDPFNRADSPDAASARSFMDLSDEDVREDDASNMNFLTPHQPLRRRLQHSNSVPSLVESLDSEAQAEAEKRRKREKLARLHRFLGSQVPLEAVNGCAIGPPLPPLAVSEQADCEHRLRGTRKSASLDEFDRGREELDESEKARNVRRAQKMERVFGAPPPQTLFHTRPMRPTAPAPRLPSIANVNPYVLTLDLPSSSRNPNQSAYMGKTLHHRPGPSDSSRCLLSHAEDTPQSSPSSLAQSFADSLFAEPSGYQQVLAQSTVYLNYQHSLNSLIDIIDRDDRESLMELYRFLRGKVNDDSSDEEAPPVNSRRMSAAASLKSERRHSLPTSVSITSLSSEYACPEISPFQIRRRKAAKLTNFFGVDYRELIDDILESIEKGVEDERKHGTLQPQEVEVLMHRVRSLRTISDDI